MRIGLVAQSAGIGIETVRYYERRGLIAQPPRPEGGFRSYSSDVVDRLRFIKQAKVLGFSLKEVEELLTLKTKPSCDCTEIRARAQSRLADVNEKVLALLNLRETLEELIEACPGEGSLDACSILNSLAGNRKL